MTLLLKIKYKFLEVYINEHHASGRSVVYFKWYGLLLDQEAMKGMDEITDLVKEVKATDLVTNFDDYKGSSIKISQYMRSTWTDDLYQAGIKRVYRNEAKGAFEQFSLNASITQDDSNPFELISYEAPRDKPDYWLSLPFIEG
ncbi:MAG: hypothetical protein LAT68_13320 [Cyclobacteriaceae bacterium]|nr:hypothetical protein [Cyclobacteriaceae bacterium]MCH8517300.1 hypothetical protein [Cyclobacteriaceae bacterium]